MYAICSGSTDIVATLVGYFLVVNYPIDKRNFVGMTPLLLAAKTGRSEELVIFIIVDLQNFRQIIRQSDGNKNLGIVLDLGIVCD